MEANTAPNPGGRPKIDDVLALFLYVEHQKAKRPDDSVREITKRRDVRFYGILGLGEVRNEPLRKETLRRRYGLAKQEIVPSSPNLHVQLPEDHPAIIETETTIRKLIEDIFG